MPRGSKDAYTDRQKRKAAHIEESYEDRGLGRKEAARRAWATVNKHDGGGRKGRAAKKRAPGGHAAPHRTAAASRRDRSRPS